jgi:apolipoprotein N-acyltransferase
VLLLAAPYRPNAPRKVAYDEQRRSMITVDDRGLHRMRVLSTAPFATLRRLSGWRADLAAGLLGALAAAALPPFHAIPVLIIAVPGLLALIDGSRGTLAAARRGFAFGFGHHLFGLYWITEAILIEAARYWWLVPLAVPFLAAILAPFIAVACAAARRAAPGWQRLCVLAGAWTLADLARQFIGTGFPWNPWASVWAVPGAFGDVMLQPLAWIGTPGVTLLTVLLAGLPTLGWRAAMGSGVAVAIWAGAGLQRLAEPKVPMPGIAVVLVQGNVAQGDKWDRGGAVSVFERYLALTKAGVAAAGSRPSVVVWPETASPFLIGADPAARAAIAEAMRPARVALVGSLRFPSGFPSGQPSATVDDLPRNSLMALSPEGGIAASYDKWHLVPFGEYGPTWIPFSVHVVPGQFAFGSGPSTLRLPGLPPVGSMICYEAIFPAQVVDEAERPAWLVNITNDAWFGNSSGPRQHLAAARMRAVEEGLPLMRAANTGITVGFDGRGHELGRLPMNVADTLVLNLPGARPATSFARWGLVIPGLLAIAFLGAGYGLAQRRILR